MSYQKLRGWHLCGHVIRSLFIFICCHLYTKGRFLLADQHSIISCVFTCAEHQFVTCAKRDWLRRSWWAFCHLYAVQMQCHNSKCKYKKVQLYPSQTGTGEESRWRVKWRKWTKFSGFLLIIMVIRNKQNILPSNWPGAFFYEITGIQTGS